MLIKLLFTLEIIILFIFPLFVRLKVKTITYRTIIKIVIFVFLFLFVQTIFTKINSEYLGLNNIFNGSIYYSILTVFVMLFLLILSKVSKKEAFVLPFNKPQVNLKNIIYLSISAFVQEFIYRAFIFNTGDYLKIPIIIAVILSTVLFGWLHIYFLDKKFIIIATIFGFFISTIYYHYPNLYFVVIIHTIGGILMNYNYKYIPIQKYVQNNV